MIVLASAALLAIPFVWVFVVLRFVPERVMRNQHLSFLLVVVVPIITILPLFLFVASKL